MVCFQASLAGFQPGGNCHTSLFWEVLTKGGDRQEELMCSAGYQVTQAYRCQHYCSTLEFLALLLSSNPAGFCVTSELRSRALPRERAWLHKNLPTDQTKGEGSGQHKAPMVTSFPVERRNSQPIEHKQTKIKPHCLLHLYIKELLLLHSEILQ